MDDNAASWDAVTTPATIASVCPNCGGTMGAGLTACPKCGAVMTGGGDAEQAERIRQRLQDAIGDGYRLLELLGRGGMGIVFRAREMALDREVALKVLALDPLLSPDAFARFEREAKMAARLDHPNIVPIFSVGQHASVAYYTMRLVRGGSIEHMLGDHAQLDFSHCLAMLRDVAAALDYAHGHGIVHRDIKPANILIGESGHAMVADFGIAKALGNTDAGATGTGIIGSPGYMSPEQWRGDAIDGRADQYALGIVAFEMLAGRRPFETVRVQDLLHMHLSADMPDLTALRPGMDAIVDGAIRRALSKDPRDRFTTVTAFIDALSGRRPVAQTGRALRYERASPPKKPNVVGRVLATMLLAAAVVLALPVPRARVVRMVRGALARDALIRAAERPRADPAFPAPDDSGAVVAAGDSTARSAAATPDSATAAAGAPAAVTSPVPLPVVPRVPTETTVIVRGGPVDTLSGRDAGFRRAPSEEYGWVRVQTRGGTSRARVDARSTGAFTPVVVRVDPGLHVISVEGSGDTFFPAQLPIHVGAGDTTEAIFWTPGALRQARADSAAALQSLRRRADSIAAAKTRADSVAAALAAKAFKPDSARKKP
jgi:Protein kinase domain